MNGYKRNGHCDLCQRKYIGFCNLGTYSCDECDWDICTECFNEQNMSETEKQRHKLEQQKKAKEDKQFEKEFDIKFEIFTKQKDQY